MAKWKVVAYKTLPKNYPNRGRAMHAGRGAMCALVSFSSAARYQGNAIRVYGLVSIAGIPYENIPVPKEDNGYGYRFVAVKPGVTINDFEIEYVDG